MKRLLLILAITILPSIISAQSSYLNILALIRGDSLGASFGKRVFPAGDVNGDGLPDYLVGCYSDYLFPPGGAQKVLLYFGKRGEIDSIPDLVFYHKSQLYWLNDINGDGGFDFAMRETGQTDRMSIYFGGTILDTVPDGCVRGDGLGGFGFQVSTGRWFTSLGERQIAIGMTWPRYDTVRYYFYNVSGNDIDSVPFLKWDRTSNNNGFQRIWFLGDINGDSFDDLAHGLPSGYSNVKGITYVYFGGPSFDTIPDVVLRPPPYMGGVEAEGFGEFLAALGDLNGDGIDDFSVGNSISGGIPFIYFGGSPLDTLPKFRLRFNAHNLANAGDINLDGYNDLIAGWMIDDITGYAYIYFGGPAMDSVADLIIRELDLPRPAYDFGQTVAGLGDIDGDGTNDFAVGSTSNTIPDWGYLWIFKGLSPTTDVGEDNTNIPRSFTLMQNYPNPFNSSTVIQYSLSKRAKVFLEVLNIAGQRVRVLEEEEQTAGIHKANWDGKDFSGKPVSSGVYLYRLKVGEETITKKMMLVR